MKAPAFTVLLLLPAASFAAMTRLPFDLMGWLLLVPLLLSLGSLMLGFLKLRKTRELVWTYFVAGLAQLPWLAIMYWFVCMEADKRTLT